MDSSCGSSTDVTLKLPVIFIFHFEPRSVLAFFTVRPSQQRLPLGRAIIASFGLILFRGFQFYNTENVACLVVSSFLVSFSATCELTAVELRHKRGLLTLAVIFYGTAKKCCVFKLLIQARMLIN